MESKLKLHFEDEKIITFYKNGIRATGYKYVEERFNFLKDTYFDNNYHLRKLSLLLSIAKWEYIYENGYIALGSSRGPTSCGLCLYYGENIRLPNRCKSKSPYCFLYTVGSDTCCVEYENSKSDMGETLIIRMRKEFSKDYYKEENVKSSNSDKFKANFTKIDENWWVMQITEMDESLRHMKRFQGTNGKLIQSIDSPNINEQVLFIRGENKDRDFIPCVTPASYMPWIIKLLNEWKDSFKINTKIEEGFDGSFKFII